MSKTYHHASVGANRFSVDGRLPFTVIPVLILQAPLLALVVASSRITMSSILHFFNRQICPIDMD